jgi:hypothetical protein
MKSTICLVLTLQSFKLISAKFNNSNKTLYKYVT